MAEIWTMGELLCEIMRPEAESPLDRPGVFYGPYPSGAPAICIDTVAKLGHSGGIIGGVGKDDFGKCILERLKGRGIECSYVTEFETGATGVAFVTYFHDGSRKFIFHLADTPAAAVKAPASAEFPGAKFFHIMGCSLTAGEALSGEILKVMDQMLAAGARISFDPNIRPELMRGSFGPSAIAAVMAKCSVLLPGEAELLTVSGEGTVEAAVARCFENPVLEVLALKRGARGCTVYTRGEQFSVDAYPTVVADVTGAGDCFDGAFLCAVLDGRDYRDAARRANAAASLNTAAFGPMEGDISAEAVDKIVYGI